MRTTILALFLLLTSAPGLADDRPLRFSVSDSSTMPMVELSEGKVINGILHDLHRRIAAHVGRTAEQLVMSRSRIQPLLAEGLVDVSCYMNPAWLDQSHASYRWSVPFMTQHSLLVALEDVPATALAQLQGERIGTVLGFDYPDAEALFRDGVLQRDDARTEAQVLAKLAAGRDRYALSTRSALDWYNRNHPDQPIKAVEQLSDYAIHCIVRDEPDVPAEAILAALRQMQQAGEFDTLLARYH
ncbi:substrate-binding periplasmic protein [Stutzerimonas chloritidismutans]|uniref:substrate-binding periplasmic protein n=1 Tax=Stutzerimonas chloritidismutans TaxID=203192 RepID=UPI003F1569F9